LLDDGLVSELDMARVGRRVRGLHEVDGLLTKRVGFHGQLCGFLL
jgi:hypothetical protein